MAQALSFVACSDGVARIYEAEVTARLGLKRDTIKQELDAAVRESGRQVSVCTVERHGLMLEQGHLELLAEHFSRADPSKASACRLLLVGLREVQESYGNALLTGFLRVGEEAKALPPAPDRSRVYFASKPDGSQIKIGVSADPPKRVRGIASQAGEEVSLMATMPGGAKKEQELHERFARLRLRGEWFRAEPELLDFIRQHAELVG